MFEIATRKLVIKREKNCLNKVVKSNSLDLCKQDKAKDDEKLEFGW
jgi:hypothetical protein